MSRTLGKIPREDRASTWFIGVSLRFWVLMMRSAALLARRRLDFHFHVLIAAVSYFACSVLLYIVNYLKEKGSQQCMRRGKPPLTRVNIELLAVLADVDGSEQHSGSTSTRSGSSWCSTTSSTGSPSVSTTSFWSLLSTLLFVCP